MHQKTLFTVYLVLPMLAASCGSSPVVDSTTPEVVLPNPASEYCVSQGYTSEIITAEDGSQSGLCVFLDGSSCDEWAYFRGECAPAEEDIHPPEATDQIQTQGSTGDENAPLPTIHPEDYAGWWTYTHPDYGFSLQLPEDWIVQEETSATNMLSGHLITLHPDPALDQSIRITFRKPGEDILLWPTGVGQGEFVPQGTLQIDGVDVQRNALVCPTGEITSIYYQGTQGDPFLNLDGLEFGIIYSASSSHCQSGMSLEGKTQTVGEMILASLTAP